MAQSAFIDTNVIVYARDSRDGGKTTQSSVTPR